MKNRTKSDQHTQAHIEDLCLVRSRFEFSAGRGLFGQNNHSKDKKKKKQKNNTNFGDSTKPFSSKPESGTPDPKRSDDDLVDAVRLNLPAILDHEMFPKRC